mmetsp:Transcript_41864/g.135382  ORF Transcript_41864/g.135382 Transcript_41864/m.135382 type:complete len:208 (+) Transcript_41864:314-937(+)
MQQCCGRWRRWGSYLPARVPTARCRPGTGPQTCSRVWTKPTRRPTRGRRRRARQRWSRPLRRAWEGPPPASPLPRPPPHTPGGARCDRCSSARCRQGSRFPRALRPCGTAATRRTAAWSPSEGAPPTTTTSTGASVSSSHSSARSSSTLSARRRRQAVCCRAPTARVRRDRRWGAKPRFSTARTSSIPPLGSTRSASPSPSRAGHAI